MITKAKIEDLADAVAKRTQVAPEEALNFVTEMFNLIAEALGTEKLVKVRGIGTFKLLMVDDRESVDVNTGRRIVIPGHNKISFTPDPVLRDEVNKPFADFASVEVNDGAPVEALMAVPADELQPDEAPLDMAAEVQSLDTTETVLPEPEAPKAAAPQPERPQADVTAKAPQAGKAPVREKAEASVAQAEKIMAAATPANQVQTTAPEPAPQPLAGMTEAASPQAAKPEAAVTDAQTAIETEPVAAEPAAAAEAAAATAASATAETPTAETPTAETSAAETSAAEAATAGPDITAAAAAEPLAVAGDADSTSAPFTPFPPQERRGSRCSVCWFILCSIVALAAGYWLGSEYPIGYMLHDVARSHRKVVVVNGDDKAGQVQQPKAKAKVQEQTPSAQATQQAPVEQPAATAAKETTAAADTPQQGTTAETQPASAEKAQTAWPQVEGGDFLIVGEIGKDTMKVGRTLLKISKRHYGSDKYVPYICVMNGITNPDVVPLNMELRLPKLKKK